LTTSTKKDISTRALYAHLMRRAGFGAHPDELDPLPLDSRQQEEVLLTAAQSLFAVSLLLDLRMSLVGALLLMGLFLIQLLIPGAHMAVTVIYFILTAANLIVYRKRIGLAFKWLRKKAAPQAVG